MSFLILFISFFLEIFQKHGHVSTEEEILEALLADDCSEYSFGGDIDEDLNLDEAEMQDLEPPDREMMMDRTEREVFLDDDLPIEEPQPEEDVYQVNEESPDQEQGADEPATSTGRKRKKVVMKKKKSKATKQPNREQWIKTDFNPVTVEEECDDPTLHTRENWTPRQYLEIFIDDDLIKMMRECTELKINMQKHSCKAEQTKSVRVKHSDMCAFIGATILMSCLKYPRIRMYWAKVTKVSSISDKISRNFYFQIRSNLKVVDDNLVSRYQRLEDKFWKIRPIALRVKAGCLSIPRTSKLAIDEQMIPFTGSACVMKQYVPNKPNPEGVKNFVLAAPNGLVLDFELYQGKDRLNIGNNNPDEFTMGECVVLRLSETVNEGTHLYFDRYFTSIRLLEILRERNMGGTGTIMSNRVPRKLTGDLMTDAVMKKKSRGTSDEIFQPDGNVVLVKWFDLKPILLVSNVFSCEPLSVCRRWSKLEKKYIEIPRPNAIGEYNKNMGGIDLIDRMISLYRIRARSNKWTVKVILHFID